MTDSLQITPNTNVRPRDPRGRKTKLTPEEVMLHNRDYHRQYYRDHAPMKIKNQCLHILVSDGTRCPGKTFKTYCCRHSRYHPTNEIPKQSPV